VLTNKEKNTESDYILGLVKKLDLKRCKDCGYNKFYGELVNFYPIYTFDIFKGEVKLGYAPEKDPQHLKITCQECDAEAGLVRLYDDET